MQKAELFVDLTIRLTGGSAVAVHKCVVAAASRCIVFTIKFKVFCLPVIRYIMMFCSYLKQRIAEMGKEESILYITGKLLLFFMSALLTCNGKQFLEITDDIFQYLLEFMYSGSCSVPDNKVSDVSLNNFVKIW